MGVNSFFNKIKDISVLVVGDSMIDSYIYGEIKRKSPEAPVPIVNVVKSLKKLGGAGNVALNLKSLGANPILCSVIGDDENGQDLLKILKKEKLRTDGIIIDKKRKTTVKKRVIVKNNHIVRIDDEITDPINNMILSKISKKIISLSKDSEILIFQDYNKGVISKKLIQTVIKNCFNIFISVDPKHANFNDFKKVDLFKPNLNEMKENFNINDTSDRKLIELGKRFITKNKIKNLMITLSERGIIIINDSQISKHKTQIKKIIDVSGAGDTIIALASLLFYLKIPQKFIGEICNLAGGMACMESGVHAIKLKELIKNTRSNNLDLYL